MIKQTLDAIVGLARTMREADTVLVTLDAMIRRDGYTKDAQETMAELRALLRTVAELAEPGPPYPWCKGNPTVADCIRDGFCKRKPSCGD